MKYENSINITSDAIYNEPKTGNPFLDAMPSLLSKTELLNKIASYPKLPYNFTEESPENRRRLILETNKLFIPMDYMYYLYDLLYRAIITNYTSKSMVDSIKQINTLYRNLNNPEIIPEYSTQSYSGAILGTPGVGKTSTIKRCLNLLPQVIIHNNYDNKPFYCKQITYLFVECPNDCSVKTLAYNIILSIDQAIGSEYFNEVIKNRSLSASALAMKAKITCMNHRVGLIVIDEIQNAVTTALKNKQTKPLIKFLVELTNETCVSICFCGTLMADELFEEQEHLRRRTRGVRLLPMDHDINYRRFVEILWSYQVTLHKTELKDKLINRLYDYSGGNPSYIIKIFQESQIQAILSGREVLDESVLKRAMEIQNIEIPKIYKKGNSISSFNYDTVDMSNSQINDQIKTESVQKASAVVTIRKRGRKSVEREALDLIEMLKKSTSSAELINTLDKNNILEIVKGA
jgi:hypothetical protein